MAKITREDNTNPTESYDEVRDKDLLQIENLIPRPNEQGKKRMSTLRNTFASITGCKWIRTCRLSI